MFANSRSSGVTNFFTGEAVPVGSTFLAGLYYALDGILDENAFFQIGLPASFSFPGLFNGGLTSTPSSTPPCGYAMFQVRVWESAFGLTFEEAITAPPQDGRLALTGKSNLIRVHTECYVPPFPPVPPIFEFGLEPIQVVPEPTALRLILLGLAALWTKDLVKSSAFNPDNDKPILHHEI